MSWEKAKLSDLCASIADGDHQSMPICEKGIPFIVISDIRSNTVDLSNSRFVPLSYYEKLDQRRKPQRGNILYSVKGSFGIPAYVSTDSPFTFQRDIAILKCNDKINSRFLFYVLKSDDYYKIADSLAIGSAQRALTLKTLNNLMVPCPPIETQRRIADILSSYDDLIENNQKQIKLLEEAAQRLYKEWFVDLRFPGWETAEIVDGVPVGWEKVSLADIAPIKTGKKDANFGTSDGQYLFFTCAQEPITAPSYSFDCAAVILAGNGDFNVKLYRGQFEAYQRTYVFSPFDDSDLYLLYHAVRESMRQLFQGASGSTIKFLTKGMLENIMVWVPCTQIKDSFNSFNESVQKQIENKKQTIQLAKEAHDRLLPKLMSGELEV